MEIECYLLIPDIDYKIRRNKNSRISFHNKYISFYAISDKVPAQKAVWFVGDEFLRTTYKEFMDMKNHPVVQLRYAPYLIEHYNIEPLHAPFNPQVRSFLARVVNSFAAGLNDIKPPHLPRYVLIFLDKDLIQNLGIFDFGVSRAIEDMLKWLLVNINNIIEVRKSDLAKKRPGALSTSSEPRLVWIQMIKRPEASLNKEIYSLSCKFNTILEDVISGDKRSHILKVHIETNETNFDRFGMITPSGLRTYWKTIDTTMKEFDI